MYLALAWPLSGGLFCEDEAMARAHNLRIRDARDSDRDAIRDVTLSAYCGDTMVLTSVILSDSEGSPRRNVEMLRFAQHDSNHHLHCVEALASSIVS